MPSLITFTNIFLLLLVSSLIFSSVHARNLVSSNGVFKLDLIHRDSPLSPYYNSSLTLRQRLKSAPLGSISRGHNIHLSTSYYYYNTSNDVKLSALIPNGGDYLMKISVGTPPVEFIAAADTGSDLIWIQCSPCDTCLSTKSQTFHPTKSSTFNIIPCTSSTCNYTDLTASGCLSNDNNKSSSPCVYQLLYGDGTQSIGILATETISLPSPDATSKSLPSSIFGCGFDNEGLGDLEDGVVGLGKGPASLISQLGPSINYKFSYCLAPLSSGVTSKLTFGADVTGPGVVSTPIKTPKTPTLFYFLSLNAITVGDKNNSVQVPTDLHMIIDSGTTLTMLSATIYERVKSALETAIEVSAVPSPMEPYDLCYNTKSSGSGAQFNPPDVVFHFQGADVVLKALNTFRDIGDDVSCLAMVATNGHLYIFGNIAQVNFQVGYDLQAKQVSFAPADCTNH